MGLKFLLFICFVTSALGGSSPHGEEILNKYYKNKNLDNDIEEDAKLDIIGLLTKYGYPSESHVVETEDGYLLTMHRIPNGKNQNQQTDKPIAFLMHGLLSSSADWITGGPDTALGYYLADAGYDVWMGNARGNHYSRKHVILDPDDGDFWQFSWNEIGFYDLPAMIDEILRITGKDKLHYIGHSQGTTTFFVMASEKPQYNDKIKSAHALAPIGYMSHLKSPLMALLAPMATTLDVLTSLIGMYEFLPNTELLTTASLLICNDDSEIQPLCSNILFLLCGFDTELLNTTLIPVYLGHIPAGSSSKQFIHYAQEYKSAMFRKYDHGIFGNLAEYGHLTPPSYNLSLVTAPVALYYGGDDWLSAVVDVFQLHGELGNPIELFSPAHPKFNHLDFLWGIDVRSLLYYRVLEVMKKYE